MSDLNSNTAVAGMVGLTIVALLMAVKYKIPKKISKDIIAVTAAKLSDATKTATNISNVLVNTAAKNLTPANTTVTNATATTATATNVSATTATATNVTATNVTAAISTHKGKAAAKRCQKGRKPFCEPLTS